jgi:hypothetical protein
MGMIIVLDSSLDCDSRSSVIVIITPLNLTSLFCVWSLQESCIRWLSRYDYGMV